MKKKTFATAACILAAVPGAAMESETLPADTIQSTTLHELEVSANRALPNTPVAMTVVSRNQIEKRNDGRDVPSLLEMTPSVVVTSDAGAGIGYSGMSVRGSDASRINVMANGVSLNDPESHVVYWVNTPDIASSLRDIQIQRGAGTSANGAGAFGASVNMVTASPSITPYGNVSLAYGMYNTHKETVRAGSGLIGGHWSVDARVSNIGSDGYIDRASSKLWSYLGQVAYTNQKTSLRLLAFGGKEETYMAWDYATREEMEKYGRRYNPCGKYTDSEGNTAFYPDQKDYFTQHHLQLQLRQSLGRGFNLTATLFYTRGLGHYEQLKTNKKLIEYGLTPYIDENGELVKKQDLVRLKYNDNHYGGANITANWRQGRWDATLGGSASWFKGGHYGQVQWVRNYLGPIDPLQKYYDNNGHKFDANIYGRLLADIAHGFSAYGDLQLRTIHYSIDGETDNWSKELNALMPIDIKRDWCFFNPKVGLNWTDHNHHRAFASWSVAHREPVRSNFTDGDRRHDPRPERMFDYEAGYTYSLPWLTAGINLYYMDYKDQLVLTGQLSDTGNPLTVNVPHSYRTGIELQLHMIPCKWFEWQANATFSRNRIKDFTEYLYDNEDPSSTPMEIKLGNTPIAFSPDVIFNNAFTFKVKGFEGSLLSHYVGRQYMTNGHNSDQKLKAYFVSGLDLSYTFLKLGGLKELRIGVLVNNIFNAKYESNGYAGGGYYINGEGKREIYRYAGYSAQATANVMGTISITI